MNTRERNPSREEGDGVSATVDAWRRPRVWPRWLLLRVVALCLGGLAVALVRGNVFFDTTYYAHWAHGALTSTRVPYKDFPWEYPPGALPAMLLPGLYAPWMADGRGSAYLWVYGVTWVVFMLGVDAAVFRTLLKRTATDLKHPALVLWMWGLPLLGALSWARYDLLPSAAAAAALLAAGAGYAAKSGALFGVGAALKLWPSLLAPAQHTVRQACAAVVRTGAVVGMTAGTTYALTGATGFGQVVSYQSQRGLQCESLAALPFLWLRHLHLGDYRTRFRFGAWEVAGAHLGLLATVVTVVFAAGLVGLAVNYWHMLRRDSGAPAVALTAMAVVLLTLTTNKVFSPQYLLWMLAVLAAACVLDRTTWRPYVAWVLLACGLTGATFPWLYGDVLGTGWLGLLALTARDAVILGLTVRTGRLLLQTSKSARRPGRNDLLEPGSVDRERPRTWNLGGRRLGLSQKRSC